MTSGKVELKFGGNNILFVAVERQSVYQQTTGYLNVIRVFYDGVFILFLVNLVKSIFLVVVVSLRKIYS